MPNSILIFFYVASNILANLTVSWYGQIALVFTALVFVPFDLTSRDLLHDRWSNSEGMKIKMSALIFVSAILTYMVSRDAERVAVASATSFFLSGVCDTVVYQLLHSKSRQIKMNSSNAASGLLDSILFPLIAFGAIDWRLSFFQWALKFTGGFFWTFFLARARA